VPRARPSLQVYKGVVAPGEFNAMVDELTSGPCIAIEVAAPAGGADAHAGWRALCGPPDPELARLLRPCSLRAQFGASRVRNGVHCTDLAEDAALEGARRPTSEPAAGRLVCWRRLSLDAAPGQRISSSRERSRYSPPLPCGTAAVNYFFTILVGAA
jgi:hypothetical protein